MKNSIKIVVVLMVLVGLVAMYTLLNAGSPNSLLRHFLPDPEHDVYVAVASSLLVFILGFILFYTRDREGFQQLLVLNAEKIRASKREGKGDAEIADAILTAMGSSGGYRHNLARKKLIVYLSDFK